MFEEHTPDPEFVKYLETEVRNPYLSAATVMQMERVFIDQRNKYEAQQAGSGEAVKWCKNQSHQAWFLRTGEQCSCAEKFEYHTRLYTHPSAQGGHSDE